MKIIKYINFKMYEQFMKQGDTEGTAILSTMFIVPVLFMFNIFLIYDVLSTIGGECEALNKCLRPLNFWYIFLMIAISNYFYIFFRHRYVPIFSVIKRSDELLKYSNIYFFIYFWLSWVGIGTWLMLKEYLKTGHLKF